MTVSANDVVRQLLEDICYLSHRHEVQTWKDAPGTPEERLETILKHSRDALAVMKGTLKPHEAGSHLADRISYRDLAASGGIVDAP